MCVMESAIERLCDGASPDQKNVILSTGSINLQACPGSGKTWTVSRMATYRLLASNDRREVALLSFTNIAVNEFKRRIREFVSARDIQEKCFIGTIDSFVDKYLISKYFYLICDLTECPRVNLLPRNDDTCIPHFGNKFINDVKFRIRNGIACFCLSRNEWYDCGSKEYKDIDSLFRRCLNTYGIYNHEMRWWLVYNLFQHEKIKRIISLGFREIIIDEAQDLNEANVWFIEEIRRHAVALLNVSFVGDDRQSIYTFRGASPEVLAAYVIRWRVQAYNLSISHRASSEMAVDFSRLFNQRMESATSLQGHGIYYVSEEELQKLSVEEVMERFGISQDCYRCLGWSDSGHKVSEYARNLIDACRDRDDTGNLKDAYYKLEAFVASISNRPLPGGKNGIVPDIWSILKDMERLPPLSTSLKEWESKIANSLDSLSRKLDLRIDVHELFSDHVLQNVNPSDEQMSVNELMHFGDTRTIHSVKGETYDGVIVKGNLGFWKQIVEALRYSNNDEPWRLFYVAVSRARRLCIIVLPNIHIVRYSDFWDARVRRLKLCQLMEG